MRAEADGRIALWSGHLARLRRDCAAVGFPLDEDRVADTLSGLSFAGPTRLRLTVDALSGIGLTHAPLPPNPPFWRVQISTVRLDSDDPWLRIKTTHRPAYDTAREALAEGVDEAILLNQRDEVCEGTITNLFLRRDGRLLTPALQCGLLPGVLRASLLARGEAEEAVLRPDDLSDGELLLGNALRGLIPAQLL
ncbi:aminotransferase class IV [Paracoccus caeni]|uniref:Probable branched-chain-amino-acid aminotransferase n=2 Tax=Paracoccus caeni TaxID=657651 RepID=A0A934SCK0_9RHOB|nr:aminotransferase class IV [Paracoccus caeni]